MEGVQGGSAQQLKAIQTQTDNASEVGKSHKRDSIRPVEAQPTPGLTDPGKVKHISLKTRIVNFLDNKLTSITNEVKAKIVGNVSNPALKAKVSSVIDDHNDGVDKLAALKKEKQGLESEVKSIEKDETFMKMVGIAKAGRSSKGQRKKDTLVLMQGEDGKLTKKAFKHNDQVANVKDMKVAVRSFEESEQYSEYTEKLLRIKDISQERAEIKEGLRDSRKQIASDLKADARHQHQKNKENLSNLKKMEIDNARNQFAEKVKGTKKIYKNLKSDIKAENKNIDERLKELRQERDSARNEVSNLLAKKRANWRNGVRGALASRLTPKGVAVNVDSIVTDRVAIKKALEDSHNKVKTLDDKINMKKKEKNNRRNIMSDTRKNRDDAIKKAKSEEKLQEKDAKFDEEWGRLEEKVDYNIAKDANKDFAKVLKGSAVKGKKKKS